MNRRPNRQTKPPARYEVYNAWYGLRMLEVSRHQQQKERESQKTSKSGLHHRSEPKNKNTLPPVEHDSSKATSESCK